MVSQNIPLSNQFQQFYDQVTSTIPRPSLHPIPGTKALTFQAAVLPPVLYFAALLLLPPPPPQAVNSFAIRSLRTFLALAAATLFLRLSLDYHVPQSIGLTYQLGLVGIYGCTRVLDAFFISAWYFNHVPRQVTYFHDTRAETPNTDDADHFRVRLWTDGGVRDPYHHVEKSNDKLTPRITRSKSRQSTANSPSAPKVTSTVIHNVTNTSTRQSTTAESASYFLHKTLSGPKPTPVYETARTEQYPTTLRDRAMYALQLELSMRGQGFTWTTADIRHTRKTWIPTISNRLHSIIVHVLPIQIIAWFIISTIYSRHLSILEDPSYQFQPTTSSLFYQVHRDELFDTLPMYLQVLLTASLGAFLMSAFSLGHSFFAVMLHPFSPTSLSFFPPLYTTRIWSLTSVRSFWSFGWHRLFARLFLVWGVWPGEFLERKLTGRSNNEAADVGKVIGAFASSAFVHAFSVRGVLGGSWRDAAGEARFFLLNGLAVVLEGIVIILAQKLRKQMGGKKMWYDRWIGRVWWISAVIWSGREFARGWVKSGLVREMAFK